MLKVLGWEMKWLIKTVILLDALALLLHGLALTLLMTLKNQILRGSQKLLLITLCVTELIYAVVDITYKTLQLLFGMNTIYYSFWVFNVITIVLMYISVMTLLTIERFLEIYLNIKYGLLCTPIKTKFVLLSICIICFLAFIPGLLISLNNPIYVGRTLVRFIYPVFELCFIIVATISYFYITKQVYKHRTKTKRLEKQLRQNNKVFHKKKLPSNKFRVFVPTLIVVTFILFTVVPNTLKLCYSLQILTADFVVEIAYIMIPVGFIVDAVIYIFYLEAVRLKIRRMIRPGNSIHTASTDY